MTPSTPETGPADIRQALMEGGREVLGPQEAERLFARLSGGRAGEFSTLHSLLQEDYGQRGGQGMAVRLGRAWLRYGIRAWSEAAGLVGTAFRLQPSPRRIRAALGALAELLDREYGAKITQNEDAAGWTWRVETCPACSGRVSPNPDCHLLAGVLQETLAWAGGGRYYRVRELECCAAGGPACLFQIDRKPLD